MTWRAFLLPVAATGSLLTVPTASADPHEFPDLSGYTTLDNAGYHTYRNYPGYGGEQFTTPAGYHCRIGTEMKSHQLWAECWGALPATSFDHAGVRLGQPGVLGNVNLAQMDDYDWFAPDNTATPMRFGPEDYKPLPSNSKLVNTARSPDVATCGVQGETTACVVDGADARHGFVLAPDGSWTF